MQHLSSLGRSRVQEYGKFKHTRDAGPSAGGDAGPESPVMEEAAVSAAEELAALQLEVKPFGKDGVRLCWLLTTPRVAAGCSLEIEMQHGGDWQTHCSVAVDGETSSGVTIVKKVTGPDMPPPRSLAWRLRLGADETTAVVVGGRSGGGGPGSGGVGRSGSPSFMRRHSRRLSHSPSPETATPVAP
eukprot:1960976-Prymnesium_polylepis.1